MYVGALAFDKTGNLYAGLLNSTDQSGEIDKITPDGSVSAYASISSQPRAMAVDGNGNLFVAAANEVIYKISPGGTSSVFASGFSAEGLAIDSSGDIYASDNGSGIIDKFLPNGTFTTVASGFDAIGPLALDNAGNLYLAVGSGDLTTIDKITPSGQVSTFASGFGDITGLTFVGSASVPEPSSLTMGFIGLGLAGSGFLACGRQVAGPSSLVTDGTAVRPPVG